MFCVYSKIILQYYLLFFCYYANKNVLIRGYILAERETLKSLYKYRLRVFCIISLYQYYICIIIHVFIYSFLFCFTLTSLPFVKWHHTVNLVLVH